MKRAIFIAIAFAAITISSIAVSAQTQLTSLDGRRVDVQGQNGKVVVLAIGAAWLPLSEKQADFTNTLAKKYAGKNVVVYFVMTDSNNPRSKNYTSEDKIKEFVTQNRLSVTVLRDPDGAGTLKKFKVDQMPSFVVLDKNGVVAGEPFGGLDPKFDITVPIGKAVDRLL